MAGDVELTIIASNEKAKQKIKDLQTRLEKLEDRLKRQHAAGRRRAQEAAQDTGYLGKLADDLTGRIGGWLNPINLATAALGRLKAEFDDLKARQAKAAGTTLDFAGAFNQLLITSQGSTEFPTSKSLEELVNGISERSGMAPKNVALALTDAFSARGVLSEKDAAVAVEAVARVVPAAPDAAQPLAGAVMDIRKSNPGITSEDALGFILQLGQTSRSTDIAKLAEHGVMAAIQVQRGGGVSLREAGALQSTLEQAMGDVQGRRAGNADDRRLRGVGPPLELDPRLAGEFGRLGGDEAVLEPDLRLLVGQPAHGLPLPFGQRLKREWLRRLRNRGLDLDRPSLRPAPGCRHRQEDDQADGEHGRGRPRDHGRRPPRPTRPAGDDRLGDHDQRLRCGRNRGDRRRSGGLVRRDEGPPAARAAGVAAGHVLGRRQPGVAVGADDLRHGRHRAGSAIRKARPASCRALGTEATRIRRPLAASLDHLLCARHDAVAAEIGKAHRSDCRRRFDLLALDWRHEERHGHGSHLFRRLRLRASLPCGLLLHGGSFQHRR